MMKMMLSKGIAVQAEVTTRNGRRIDLVTNRYAIECKPTLTRDAMLRAAAQMKLYESSFPHHEHVLAGMSPRSSAGYRAAHSTAVDIKKEFGYTVWFIDRMSFFTELRSGKTTVDTVTDQKYLKSSNGYKTVKPSGVKRNILLEYLWLYFVTGLICTFIFFACDFPGKWEKSTTPISPELPQQR